MCTSYAYIQHMADYGTIDKEDLDLFLMTDSVEEMENHIKKFAIEGYGLKRKAELARRNPGRKEI